MAWKAFTVSFQNDMAFDGVVLLVYGNYITKSPSIQGESKH